MSTALASSVGVSGFGMSEYSPMPNNFAIDNFRRCPDDQNWGMGDNVGMDDFDDDRNGGPNHLRSWMRFRRMSGAKLAGLLGTTPSVVSELVTSKTALSAKWLRRIAPHLGTTPGMLLDHDPLELDANIIDIWTEADARQRRQLADIAKTIVRTGTDG